MLIRDQYARYSHLLYDERLKHWSREMKQVKAEGGASRTKIWWINLAAEQESQLKLF